MTKKGRCLEAQSAYVLSCLPPLMDNAFLRILWLLGLGLRAPSCPRFPPWEASERRPRTTHDRPARVGVRNPSPKRPYAKRSSSACALAITGISPSSHDKITDFTASRDTIDFTNIAGINAHNGIATFEGKLTGSGNLTLNAHSVAYLVVNGNTEVLVNTTDTAETVTSANVSAANMEIVLVGIHNGLASTDFHHV